MVSATGVLSPFTMHEACRVPEPPAITAAMEALHEVVTTFANTSIQATALGLKELDAGEFVTLDELEAALRKKG